MMLERERRALCAVGRRLAETGLVTGASGNASVRSGDLVAVTPGGMMLDRMRPEDCPVVDVAGRLADGERVPSSETRVPSSETRVPSSETRVPSSETRVPSSETPMHLALYRATPAAAIVHTHSTYSAVVATTMTELPPIHYNTLLLGGVVKVAEYATYGTPELAANVEAAMAGGKRAALMANHGGVAIGGDLDEAFENARLLEWLCGVYVRAKTIGEPRVLTGEELARVAERGLTPPGFPDVT